MSRELAFTLCQVPVVCRPAADGIVVQSADGSEARITGTALDAGRSPYVFLRSGDVTAVIVQFKPE